MSNEVTSRGQKVIAEIQEKLRNLIQEFGKGLISNEQFNILYERYSNQLSVAMSLSNTAPQQSTDVSTVMIREATTGRAIGLGIYHHKSGTIIETLGNFEVSPEISSPILNAFSAKIENNDYIEPHIQQSSAGYWIVFMARRYTTSIVLFKNEPAPIQIKEIERLQHDFEQANERFLGKQNIDSSQLARPFIGFVKRKLNQ